MPVKDLGYLRQALHKQMFGIKSAEEHSGIPPAEAASINRQHNWFLTGVVVLMVLLLALGIGNDFWEASSELGERSVSQPVERR